MNFEQAIREAAEIVGWKYAKHSKCYYIRERYEDAIEYWYPSRQRSDLHALVGLLEEWCREEIKTPLSVQCGEVRCVVKTKDYEIEQVSLDWLHAKLFALLELARTLR